MSNGREYDIIIFNKVRLINGIPLTIPWNVEIETPRINARTIREKYDSECLLSFISRCGASRKASFSSDQVYSITDYVYKEHNLSNYKINFNSKYLLKITGQHNLNVLGKIMGEDSIEPELKRSVLFFLGDLINEYRNDSKFFFEPNDNPLSKNLIMMNLGEFSENLFLCSHGIIEKIINKSLNSCLEHYLKKSKFSERLTKMICSREVSLIATHNSNEHELVDLCRNSEVSKIYFVSGTKLEVGAGESLIKEIKC